MPSVNVPPVSIVNSANVVVVGTCRCPYTQRALAFLHQVSNEVKYCEIDTIANGAAVKQEVVAQSQNYLFPQVFIKGNFVGGALDVEALSRTGELERLVR